MYEAVAVITSKTETQILFEIVAHNITKKEAADGLIAILKRDGLRPVLYPHMLHHPGEPFGCKSCLSAIEEQYRAATERASNERSQAGGADPPPFEASTSRSPLVLPAAGGLPTGGDEEGQEIG